MVTNSFSASFADTYRKYRERKLAEDPTWTFAKVKSLPTFSCHDLSFSFRLLVLVYFCQKENHANCKFKEAFVSVY